MRELILGGVKSGKSRLAERHALESGLEVVVVATADAGDDEMRRRIEQHRKNRPPQWRVVESGADLAGVLEAESGENRCLVVDCLTLWLTRLLCEDLAVEAWIAAFLDVLPALPGRIILVSNETGMGIVPLGELSRRYCDEAGKLHQKLGEICDNVILTVAGLPLRIKSGGMNGLDH